MGEIDPVFNPQKCDVEVVERIPFGLQIIEECDIPPSPQPIFDCPDFDLPIPPPIRPPGGGPPCPQFEVLDTLVFPGPVFALSFDIELIDEPTPEDPNDPCKYEILLTFEHPPFPVIPPTIDIPCPQFEIESTVSCTEGPCSVDVTITPIDGMFTIPCCGSTQQSSQQIQTQACGYQLAFQFQIPQGPEGPQGPCPDLTASASIECITGPCELDFQFAKDATPGACGYDFFFGFQVQRGPQGPPGSKTAIVPVPTTDGREDYLGLFCMEMPEAIFMDVLTVRVTGQQSEAMIDPRFIGACEERSIRVVSAVPVEPVAVGAQVIGDKAVVKIAGFQKCPEVTVMVAGKRAGAWQRFPKYTKEQMDRNNNFWDSATKEQ